MIYLSLELIWPECCLNAKLFPLCQAFVESNPSIKWCPYPGCGRAVKLPGMDNPLSPRSINDLNSQDYSHAVDCGNKHTFCWECLGEAHEPASCNNWKLWQQKIGEINPENCELPVSMI